MILEKDIPPVSISDYYGRLVSDSLPCPGVTWDQFLYQAEGLPRYYWENKRDEISLAGRGTAIELTAWGEKRFETIQNHAEELFAGSILFNDEEPLASPRLFGGFAFREDFVPDKTWWDFTPAHFVLPHYQLLSVRGQTWLTINASIPQNEDPKSIQDELRRALQAKISELQARSRIHKNEIQDAIQINYPLPYDIWRSNIANATQRIRDGELKKVVLARIAEARFDHRVNVLAVLQYLAEVYPDTYRFLFEPRPFHAFYGATPELLVKVSSNTLETMALAGSIGRGSTPEMDEIYAQQLLSSVKDRHEHQLVVDEIRRRLIPLTSDLNIADTGIMRLSNIQHIHTPIQGKLKHGKGVLPIVAALHPTPALGGDPRELAMTLISELETVPRGWYGAPIGWIDRHMDGQFGVGIRSAVVQDKRVWMYAGVGIVAASDPQKEWDETELKFRPMLNALGIPGMDEVR